MSSRTTTVATERLPSRWQSVAFECKAWAFRIRRALVDRLRWPDVLRHARATMLRASPVLADFEGTLWPEGEPDDTLVVGKIHNLRLAAKQLHGIEIPAGETFSFWKQLGRASAMRGFVLGRELREGCVIPAIGGGLCQLSNAIYDAAVRAGIDVVERHRHSRVLPGSLAEFDRDATVFWNYLDLRLRAPFAWRVEIDLDAERLRVRLRGDAAPSVIAHPVSLNKRTPEATGDCASCDEQDCHRHVGPQPLIRRRTWLIAEPWPEFLALLNREHGAQDRVLGVQSSSHGAGFASVIARWHAALRLRWALRSGQPLPKARGDSLQVTARALARQLRPDDLHLVVAQGLLPYLWRDGELAGRRFDVLMSALPMDAIQQRLDMAASVHPDCETLRDFRAPPDLLEAEREALVRAGQWISPHTQILALAGTRATPLEWCAPPRADRGVARGDQRPTILFPASTLARKGALELAVAVNGLHVRLLAPHGAAEAGLDWGTAIFEHVASIDAGMARADLLVLPAWIEHQPRSLLAAIARGIPVIATAACGLPPSPAWECVPEGDVAALRLAITQCSARIETQLSA